MARVLIPILILLLVASAPAQEMLWPLANHEYLTGGHADSRTDHFHGGVDIRTGGRQLPVLAPLTCWVERIAVSPSGYGKVLYVRLENGQTAVFGHLDRFVPFLETAVRDSQLAAGTYRVDFRYESPSGSFRFIRGDTLAYTGETGRGAPHLHYELRNEAVQTDPLLAYDRPDDEAPVIVELRWLRLSDFTTQATGRKLSIRKQTDGYLINESIVSDEPVGFLISCYDRSSWSRPAVPAEIRVRIGDKMIYQTHPTQIDLLGPRDIHARLVWAERRQHDKDTRRLFRPPAGGDPEGSLTGWISEGEEALLTIEVIDRAGNVAAATVELTVEATTIEQETQPLTDLSWGAFSIYGDPETLTWISLEGKGTREVMLGNALDGLYDRITLSYRIQDGEDRTGLYWYTRNGKGNQRPLWTVPGEPDSIMSCYLQRGGTYGIARDKTPPVLWISKRNGKLFFDLRDSETGIDDSTVRCTVDGRTAIPEYEYEEDGGEIWMPENPGNGTHQIVFHAANRAGIEKTWQVNVSFP